MHILIAPDSFKGSMNAQTTANAIAEGILTILPQATISKAPLADGGEGSLDNLIATAGGRIYHQPTIDALGRPLEAAWGGILTDNKTAIIEIAAASGLTLIPPTERRTAFSSSRGSGIQIRQALDAGYRRFIIALGGSATTDAGCGLLSALGLKLLDADNQPLPDGGLALALLSQIDSSELDLRLNESIIQIACDVTNPLCGENGAAFTYARQKGASDEEIVALDAALFKFATLASQHCQRDCAKIPGAGAAGGIAAGLMYFTNAELLSGFQLFAQASQLEQKIAATDIVITGEGRTDAQTLSGKVPFGVCQLARKYNKPVICLSGSLADGYEQLFDCGLTAAFSIASGPLTLAECSQAAYLLTRNAAANITRLLLI